VRSGLYVSTVWLAMRSAYDQIACQDLEDFRTQTSTASEDPLKHLDE
jgi:hypothetical protein